MIDLLVAARPNFVKLAPLVAELKRRGGPAFRVVHTGQHYDLNMSDAFFEQFDLDPPDVNLGIRSGSPAQQIGRVLCAYDTLLEAQGAPRLCIVVGDVNAASAGTIAASKRGVPLAHLEAGLRSFDRSMPEESNREIADRLADILWTPSEDAVENLRREGVREDAIAPVGNIMIDSFAAMRPRWADREAWRDFSMTRGSYALATLHRPGNVDVPATLSEICAALNKVAASLPVVFPVHPRTAQRIRDAGLEGALDTAGVVRCEPLDYVRFQSLMDGARLVITDSGGVQEETSFLGVPCLTVRPNTERPITLTLGTNRLVAPNALAAGVTAILEAEPARRRCEIPMWDGRTAGRVVDSIERFFASGLP